MCIDSLYINPSYVSYEYPISQQQLSIKKTVFYKSSKNTCQHTIKLPVQLFGITGMKHFIFTLSTLSPCPTII